MDVDFKLFVTANSNPILPPCKATCRWMTTGSSKCCQHFQNGIRFIKQVINFEDFVKFMKHMNSMKYQDLQEFRVFFLVAYLVAINCKTQPINSSPRNPVMVFMQGYFTEISIQINKSWVARL